VNRAALLALARAFATRRMLIAGLMGFSSGLPLLLIGTLLQAWLTERGVSIEVIGLFALVGLPYTFKFLWAPLFDRYRLPLLGRRRGWLCGIQILLVLAIAAIGWIGVPNAGAINATDPARILADHPFDPALLAVLPEMMGRYLDALGGLLPGLVTIALAAFAVAFFSASQDTLIDAYRRESLHDEEQGLGASLYVWGYRLAMLFAAGGGLILAGNMSFSKVFYLMAGAMAVGIIPTLIAREPPSPTTLPTSLLRAVVDPLTDFFRNRYRPLLILGFILLYKLGDSMAASLSTVYFLKLGFDTETIGIVVKLFGFWAIIAGAVLGGTLILRLGIMRSLFVFGILQGISTAAFSWLSYTGPSSAWLAMVVSLENFTGGMGTAAFVGYMALLTDRQFTATQYALLSSLMGVPRVIISSFTGFLAAALGWPLFFLLCAVIAIPGLSIIPLLRTPDSPSPATGERPKQSR